MQQQQRLKLKRNSLLKKMFGLSKHFFVYFLNLDVSCIFQSSSFKNNRLVTDNKVTVNEANIIPVTAFEWSVSIIIVKRGPIAKNKLKQAVIKVVVIVAFFKKQSSNDNMLITPIKIGI